MTVKYIQAAVVKLSACGKYMGNILQPHNTLVSSSNEAAFWDESV